VLGPRSLDGALALAGGRGDAVPFARGTD